MSRDPQPDAEKHTAMLLIPKLNSDARYHGVGVGWEGENNSLQNAA